MLKKEKSTVEGDPRESWSAIEAERGSKIRRGGNGGELGGDPLRRGLTFSRIERKTPVLKPALHYKKSSLGNLYRSRDRGGGKPNGQVVSIKRTADGRR